MKVDERPKGYSADRGTVNQVLAVPQDRMEISLSVCLGFSLCVSLSLSVSLSVSRCLSVSLSLSLYLPTPISKPGSSQSIPRTQQEPVFLSPNVPQGSAQKTPPLCWVATATRPVTLWQELPEPVPCAHVGDHLPLCVALLLPPFTCLHLCRPYQNPPRRLGVTLWMRLELSVPRGRSRGRECRCHL